MFTPSPNGARMGGVGVRAAAVLALAASGAAAYKYEYDTGFVTEATTLAEGPM